MNVTRLVDWSTTNPEAILQQAAEGVQYARGLGEAVGVVVCVVRHTAGGNCYDVCYSKLPAEVVAWAAGAIQRKAEII